MSSTTEKFEIAAVALAAISAAAEQAVQINSKKDRQILESQSYCDLSLLILLGGFEPSDPPRRI